MITAYILPTYNESSTLPILLNELKTRIKPLDLIVVADDSSARDRYLIEIETQRHQNVYLSPGHTKAGRGAAVYRSILWILKERSEITHIVEADCDGSHRIQDIIAVASCEATWEFVIGSRYLPESRIEGWSNSRRALSYLLNKLIPKVLAIDCSDITNGLRRYTRRAASTLASSIPTNGGFIYLSEQASRLKSAGIAPVEIPIIFESRIAGVSSVTLNDLLNSFFGLLSIIVHSVKRSWSSN